MAGPTSNDARTRGTIRVVPDSFGPDDRYRGARPGDRTGDPRSTFGRPPTAVPAGVPAGANGPGGPGQGGNGPGGPGGPARLSRGKDGPAPRGARGPQGPGRNKKGGGRPPAEQVVPVRRMLSIVIAGFAILLAFGLVIATQASQIGFTVVIFGAQVFFVLAWTVASRPPSPWITAIIGLVTAAGSAIAINVPVQASLAPLGYVVAGAFIASVLGQF